MGHPHVALHLLAVGVAGQHRQCDFYGGLDLGGGLRCPDGHGTWTGKGGGFAAPRASLHPIPPSLPQLGAWIVAQLCKSDATPPLSPRRALSFDGGRSFTSTTRVERAQEADASRNMQFVIAVVLVGVITATSFAPNIDWAAHVGGLVGGVLCATAIWGGPSVTPPLRRAHAPPPPAPRYPPWCGKLLRYTAGCGYVGLVAGGSWVLWGGATVPPPALLDYCALVVKPAYPWITCMSVW